MEAACDPKERVGRASLHVCAPLHVSDQPVLYKLIGKRPNPQWRSSNDPTADKRTF
jgi:hypothetical protein